MSLYLINPSRFGGSEIELIQGDRGEITSDETTTNASFEASGLTVTLPDNGNSKSLICCACVCTHGTASAHCFYRLDIGGSTFLGSGVENSAANRHDVVSIFATANSDGSTVTVDFRTDTGTATLHGTGTDDRSHIEVLSFGGGDFTASAQRDEATSDETISGATWQDTTLAITVANRSGGMCQAVACVPNDNNGFQNNSFAMTVNGTRETANMINTSNAAAMSLSELVTSVSDLDGTVVKLQYNIAGGTATLFGTSDMHGHLEILELSGATFSELSDECTADDATSNTSYEASTLSVTLGNITDGIYMAVFVSDSFATANIEQGFAWNQGGVREDGVKHDGRGSSWVASMGMFKTGDMDGGSMTVDQKTSSSSSTMRGGSGSRDKGHFRILQVSP